MSDEPSPTDPPVVDEQKERFKQALAAKNSRNTRGGAPGAASGAVHGAHGPAASKRSFRRKSGS